MPSHDSEETFRSKLTRQGEDALGRAAQELLNSPLFKDAVQRALGAREKAAQAQEVAMGALNLPSAADLERLTRRLRSVSQRMEGIEDGLDRVEDRVRSLDPSAGLDERLRGVESRLEVIAGELAEIRQALPDPPDPLPREQERMEVES